MAGRKKKIVFMQNCMKKPNKALKFTPLLFSCATVNEDNISGYDSRCSAMSKEERISYEKPPYYKPPPICPGDAARKGIDGYVEFEFDISTQGQPINKGGIGVYPTDSFVNAVLRSLQGYKYDIEIVNGEPAVSYWQHMRVLFEIEK